MKKIWSKKHSLRLGENWSYGPLQFRDIFGVQFPNQFIGYKEGFGYGFVDDVQLQECYKHVIGEIYKQGFEEYFEKRALIVFQNFFVFCKEVADLDFSKIDLYQKWQELLTKEDEWMNYVWMVFLLDEGLTNELKKRLKEIRFDNEETYIPAMIAPTDKTAAYELKVDLLKAAKKLKEGEEIQEDLRGITKKYSYFSILNMDEEPLTEDYFKNELTKLVEKDPAEELAQLVQDEGKVKSLYEEVRQKLAQHPDILRLIEACKKVAYYREYRNDLRQESYFYARHLYVEIAKKAAIPLSDLIFATRDEIGSLLKEGSPIKNEPLKERRAYSALVSDYESKNITYLFDKEKILKSWPEEKVDTSVKEFKGISAFAGKVVGKARIIFDVSKQANDFKEGEILVATTTNLTFIPLMGKAAAIITDEGGLLTHTAIVARELKKVAIVGTKVATKILKDGDEVEVDAEKGIVKLSN